MNSGKLDDAFCFPYADQSALSSLPPMIPIQDLLHRIQWDPEFGKGRFLIGYYDRLDDRIVRVGFQHVHLAHGEHFSFDVVGDDGSMHMVPFHRVREVWRNGELIWQRKAA